MAQTNAPENTEYATGKVLEITSLKASKAIQETFGEDQIIQKVKIKVLTGKLKGKIVETENQLTNNPAYNIDIKQGKRVILEIEKAGNKQNVFLADIERIPALMIIVGLFASLLLIIGGIKGLRSLFSLGITSGLIFFIMVPAVLKGLPIIPLSVAIAGISTLVTMFTICGVNIKSLSASLGVISSLAITGIISIFIVNIAPLTGFTDQESIILWASRPDLNFTGLLTGAMIIGALGALMDVGISIASSIEEVRSIDNNLNWKQLFNSGMNVGKDIMGTMSNTLILAYIGSSFPLVLLAADAPLVKLINLNSIATEIATAVIGSIGLILCIPITAIISGTLYGKFKKIKN